jgi:hypothetical protein
MSRKNWMALAVILALGSSVVSVGIDPALKLAPFAIALLGLGALISARMRNQSA